jgi:Ca2+-transporting ATPase
MAGAPPAHVTPPYRRTAADVVAALRGDAQRGLAEADAAERLRRDGANELPPEPRVPTWRRFLAQFRGLLTALLLVATAVSLAVWWIERDAPVPYEALTILAIVLLNGILGFVQEARAEQAVAALRAMSAPAARVLRDGQARLVPSAGVVVGDLLVLEEGDTVAADARVVEAIELRTAESALTGESTPVPKDPAALDGDR